jgi:hypothetical protein
MCDYAIESPVFKLPVEKAFWSSEELIHLYCYLYLQSLQKKTIEWKKNRERPPLNDFLY